MREPYSNHYVRLSICPFVCPFTLCCNAISHKYLNLQDAGALYSYTTSPEISPAFYDKINMFESIPDWWLEDKSGAIRRTV